MKKNFVKKLALGLALVMAVTSVPVSSEAASKPAFKTASVEVKEGETVTATVNKTKAYNFKKVVSKNTEVATATLKEAKNKKVLVDVTGVKAGEAKIVAKFKKAGEKAKKAKMMVTVVAEEKAEMTVEATGVRQITVKFNKAVDTTATVVVKKGTIAPNVASTRWAEDDKTLTINMGSKLTKGTYEVKVGELSGSVVTEDETLTSIEFVGTSLVADATVASQASISFKTLNQYGERMTAPGAITPTSSFSASVAISPNCSPKQNGVITISSIPTMFQILGTAGTVTLVDHTKGVTATANVTYSAAATAKTMTVAGIYNRDDRAFADVTKGNDVADYGVAVQAQDQYGNALDARFLNAAATRIRVTAIAGGNVAGVQGVWEDVTIDGVDYVALQLAPVDSSEKASTGTFYFTFVNEKVGLLANSTFNVKTGTVIKSLDIYANDTIYEGQWNELGFEAIDENGNAVTKYSDLKNIVITTQDRKVATSGDDGVKDTVKFEKQADGSAKLYFKPEVTLVTGVDGNDKQTTIANFTVGVNEVTTTNYFVKPVTFTVSQKRYAVEVVGVKAGTATAVASGSTVTLALKNILVEDQYSNVMSAKEVSTLGSVINVEIPTSIAGVTNGSVTTTATDFSATSKKVTFDAVGSEAGDVTSIFLNVGAIDTRDNYVNNFELKLYTVDSYKASNLTISYVNDGYTVKAATGAALAWVGNPQDLDHTDVEVTGTVGGRTVVIPNTQYKVSANTGYALDYTKYPETTQTATIEVTVDTEDGPVVLTKEYAFSNARPTLTTMIDLGGTTCTISGDKILDASELAQIFYMDDQYGTNVLDGAFSDAGVKYTVIDVTGAGEDTRTITHNATHDVRVTNVETTNRFTVTATKGDLTVTKTVEIQ